MQRKTIVKGTGKKNQLTSYEMKLNECIVRDKGDLNLREILITMFIKNCTYTCIENCANKTFYEIKTNYGQLRVTFFKERLLCSFKLFLAAKKMAMQAATIKPSGTTKNAKVLKMATSFQPVNILSSAMGIGSSQENAIPAKILTVYKN